MNDGIHAVVSGVVQGVFFRAETQSKAQSLGLSGWVRNLPTGQVELEAFGSEEAVEALLVWLNQGPPSASVDDVVVGKIGYEPCQGFEIRATPNS